MKYLLTCVGAQMPNKLNYKFGKNEFELYYYSSFLLRKYKYEEVYVLVTQEAKSNYNQFIIENDDLKLKIYKIEIDLNNPEDIIQQVSCINFKSLSDVHFDLTHGGKIIPMYANQGLRLLELTHSISVSNKYYEFNQNTKNGKEHDSGALAIDRKFENAINSAKYYFHFDYIIAYLSEENFPKQNILNFDFIPLLKSFNKYRKELNMRNYFPELKKLNEELESKSKTLNANYNLYIKTIITFLYSLTQELIAEDERKTIFKFIKKTSECHMYHETVILLIEYINETVVTILNTQINNLLNDLDKELGDEKLEYTIVRMLLNSISYGDKFDYSIPLSNLKLEKNDSNIRKLKEFLENHASDERIVSISKLNSEFFEVRNCIAHNGKLKIPENIEEQLSNNINEFEKILNEIDIC